MSKIIFLLAILNTHLFAANNDSIDFSASVDPACEVIATAEPVASNLDLTTSQTDLKIGRYQVNHNGLDVSNSNTYNSPYWVVASYDFEDDNQIVNGSHSFTFSNLKLIDFESAIFPSVPFAQTNFPGLDNGAWIDLHVSYLGIPALSLLQGVYSTTWYLGCNMEEI